MAIQLRRGAHSAFDASKLVPGELAMILSGDPDVDDGKSVVACFSAGDVKKLLMREDAAELLASALGEALEMSLSSANDAITVTSDETEEGVTYELAHKAPFSESTSGLDPTASTSGGRTSLGTTEMDFGDAFWVPAVSVDKYGHVTAVSYRKLELPESVKATTAKLGMVRPDGVSVYVDSDGIISARRPTVDAILSDTSENAVQNKVVKEALDAKGSTSYATSSTTASTAAKVAACTGFELMAGAVVAVAFSTANTANTPTLDVNSTGAKDIRLNGSAVSGENQLLWDAGEVLTFIYDGTRYHLIARSNASAGSGSGSGSTWYGTSSSADGSPQKAVTCTGFSLVAGAMIAVTFSAASTGANTVQLNVNSTGDKTVYLNNAASGYSNKLKWDAGDTLTFVYDGTYYHLVARDAVHLPFATSSVLGCVKTDNRSIVAANDGTISAQMSCLANCGTAASTATKAASGSDSQFVLCDYAIVSVNFRNANTVEGEVKLNVDSTGAKTIYYKGSATSSSNKLLWSADDVLTFIYDSMLECYHLIAKV